MAKSVQRYELSDSEWERLKPYFEKEELHKRGRPRRNARELLNAILWITRSGAAWRDLPERYGAWQTAYKRFVQWLESGLLENVFHELNLDADLENISIDSTYIKAHKASAGAQRGGC